MGVTGVEEQLKVRGQGGTVGRQTDNGTGGGQQLGGSPHLKRTNSCPMFTLPVGTEGRGGGSTGDHRGSPWPPNLKKSLPVSPSAPSSPLSSTGGPSDLDIHTPPSPSVPSSSRANKSPHPPVPPVPSGKTCTQSPWFSFSRMKSIPRWYTPSPADTSSAHSDPSSTGQDPPSKD